MDQIFNLQINADRSVMSSDQTFEVMIRAADVREMPER